MSSGLTHSTKSSQVDPTLKTRHFADVIQEITRSMEIHRQKGTILGGVHLELTGEVNEDGFSVVSISNSFVAKSDRMHWRVNGAPRQGLVIQLPDSLRSSTQLRAVHGRGVPDRRSPQGEKNRRASKRHFVVWFGTEMNHPNIILAASTMISCST